MGRARFRAGERVRLWAAEQEGAEDAPLVVPVDVVEKRRIWVLAPDAPLEIGDRVLLERVVVDDARYQGPFEVVSKVRRSLALVLTDDWKRVQDRDFVRVATPRLPVQGVWPEPERPPLALRMLDLSAGGMRVECHERLEPEDEIECRFELEGCRLPFAIPARVRRATSKRADGGGACEVGLQFPALPYPVASELTRWIFRAQIRRNNARGR